MKKYNYVAYNVKAGVIADITAASVSAESFDQARELVNKSLRQGQVLEYLVFAGAPFSELTTLIFGSN